MTSLVRILLRNLATNPELLEPLRKQPHMRYNISVNTKLDEIVKNIQVQKVQIELNTRIGTFLHEA